MTTPSTQNTLNDLAIENNHVVSMKFYPVAWLSAHNSSHTWKTKDFPPNPRNSIPKKPGVYIFVVTPDIFNFPPSSGLFYIGKATSLYERISSYIGEIDKDFFSTKRPNIWHMVNLWNGHLKYHFTTTQNVSEAEALEKEMLNAFRPPFNTQYYGNTSLFERARL